MYKKLTIILLITILSSCTKKPQSDFFHKLSQLCGQSFIGESVFPDDPGDDFRGKKLVMDVSKCNSQEIRVPFKVGDDSSRTWVFTKTDSGLLLKHDHRHEDGTPHDLTMYGGYADSKSTDVSVNFAADNETAQMLPEAKTNVWTLSFDEENHQFVYFLKRHDKPRFKAVFDISH